MTKGIRAEFHTSFGRFELPHLSVFEIRATCPISYPNHNLLLSPTSSLPLAPAVSLTGAALAGRYCHRCSSHRLPQTLHCHPRTHAIARCRRAMPPAPPANRRRGLLHRRRPLPRGAAPCSSRQPSHTTPVLLRAAAAGAPKLSPMAAMPTRA